MNRTYSFQKAPRCSATSKRTRERCKAPAVRGWTVCRFHGARGGGPRGKRNGMFKHGLFPDSLAGVPVDVREARPYQRLRAADPLAAEITQTYRRPEQAEPEWPLERELPSGELLTSPNSETQQKLAAQRKGHVAFDHEDSLRSRD